MRSIWVFRQSALISGPRRYEGFIRDLVKEKTFVVIKIKKKKIENILMLIRN